MFLIKYYVLVIGKKVGMTSIFDENGKKYSLVQFEVVHGVYPVQNLRGKTGTSALQLGLFR